MMEKIIAEKFFGNDPKKLDVFHNWGNVNRSVIAFENQSTQKTFEFLFGEKHGERLWLHFVIDCERNLNIFKTYLLDEQFNDLLVNIHYNSLIYAK